MRGASVPGGWGALTSSRPHGARSGCPATAAARVHQAQRSVRSAAVRASVQPTGGGGGSVRQRSVDSAISAAGCGLESAPGATAARPTGPPAGGPSGALTRQPSGCGAAGQGCAVRSGPWDRPCVTSGVGRVAPYPAAPTAATRCCLSRLALPPLPATRYHRPARCTPRNPLACPVCTA